MDTVDVRPFEGGTGEFGPDAAAIARLSTTVQWPSLTDPEVVEQVCTAPGASAYVAESGGVLVGWAQALGDGVLQSHLGFLAVHPDHRRRGIARLLVVATFQATGTLRMDLVADAAHGADPFYERFAHTRLSGFRLYPGADT
jgi:ribosomal protein S18 acetylase RimI-like enzyme